MSQIYVCSLRKLQDVTADVSASHIATFINEGTPVERPGTISPENHLFLGMNDISAAIEGMVSPALKHIEEYLKFVDAWDKQSPLIVHCWAGVSRSTAGAIIGAAYLRPELSESEIVTTVRARSTEATPNKLLIAMADEILKRDGRLIAAVEDIGRGSDCFEGSVFNLNVGNANVSL